MTYNISAVSLPESIVGINREEKGSLARTYPNTLYDVDVPREQLIPFLQQPMVWSPFQFRDNKRNQMNSKLNIGLLVFDSDDDAKYDEIKTRFHAVFEHFIIMPSSGWTPEYEKYRVIVPLSENVDLMSDNHYKTIMKYFAKKLRIKMDSNAMETARFFFSDLNPGIPAYDTCGVNHVSIVNRCMLATDEDKSLDLLIKRHRRKSKVNTGQIEPKHVVKKMKYNNYLNDITPGNYHNGEIAMIGYLSKCGCLASDIESHIEDLRIDLGYDATPIQHKNRMSIL